MTLILTLPGLGGSGPDHWQSRWDDMRPGCRRVNMPDWNIPDYNSWMTALDEAVRACVEAPLLVAHSLSCLLVAHWALDNPDVDVKGALMVAPPDLDDPERVPAEALVFAPMPLKLLPFPATVLASSNDPYADARRAQAFATAWGADFHNLGPWGHLNSDSHLGEWDEGWKHAQDLLAGSQNVSETRA